MDLFDGVDFDGLDFEDDDDREAVMMSLPIDDDDRSAAAGDESEIEVGGEDFLGGSGFPPALSKWKDSPFNAKPKVTIDHARTKLWDQAKDEIAFFLRKISEHETDDAFEDLGGNEEFLQLLDLMFGIDSEVYHAFKKVIPKEVNGMSRWEVYCRFLATFFFVCLNNRTYSKLYEYTRADTTGFVDPELFDQVWTSMEEYNKKNPAKPRFWKLLEEAFNKQMKEFIMPSEDGRIILGTDDDKVHFGYRAKKNMPAGEESGLKRVRHVKDNVRGFTNHVVSFAATGVPIQSAFERENQTIFDCAIGLMKGMFGSENSEVPPDLSDYAMLNVDRGYLRLALLVWWLQTGGDVLSTVMRQEWFPLTFGDKEPHNKSKPENIDVKGPKCVFQKTFAHNFGKSGSKNHKLTATAYRSGTSSTVNLAVHSDHHQRHWDLVVAKPKDLKDYNVEMSDESRFMRGFKLLMGEDEEAKKRKENQSYVDHDSLTHQEVLERKVTPLTESQGDASWFMERENTMTSFSSDKCISATAPFINSEHEMREHYETVLNCFNLSSMLPDGNAENNDEDSSGDHVPDWLIKECERMNRQSMRARQRSKQREEERKARAQRNNDESESADESKANEKADEESDDDKDKDEDASVNTDDCGLDDEIPALDDRVNEFLAVYQSKSLDLQLDGILRPEDVERFILTSKKEFIVNCMKKLGASKKESESDDANQKLYEWTQTNYVKRWLAYKKKPELVEIAKKYPNIKIKTTLRVGPYRNELAEKLMGIEMEELNSEEGLELALQTALLSSTLMKPLKAGSSEGMSKYTAKGQRLEKPFLQEWFVEMDEIADVDEEYEALYCPGLVESKRDMGSRDSADGVVLKSQENGLFAFPVEVKSRVTANTYHRERERLNRLQSGANIDSRKNFYHQRMLLRDEKERKRVLEIIEDKHELFQLLHHCYVYGIDSCFFVVGDKSRVMFSLQVVFPANVLRAYRKIVQFLYETGCKWTMAPGDEVPEIPSVVMKAFAGKKLKSLKMTTEALQCRLGLWRALNCPDQRAKTKIDFPLPPLARIVPYTVSAWNVLKPGGDTITKLDDDCQERIGIRTENNVACARILLNLGVVVHRIYQMITADEDLDYPTLHHYRNAASQRTGMKDSIEDLIEMLTKMAEAMDAKRGKKRKRAEEEKEEEEEEEIDMDIFAPKSPSIKATKRLSRGKPKTPEATTLTFQSPKTSKTPGKGQPIGGDYPEHDERAKNCVGVIYYKLMPGPDDNPSKDMRNYCEICKNKTDWFCSGCHRYLCNKPAKPIEPPKKRKSKGSGDGSSDEEILQTAKLPKRFSSKVPKLNPDTGKISLNEDREPEFVEEFGQYTCYIHAHHKRWKAKAVEDNKALMQEISKKHRESMD